MEEMNERIQNDLQKRKKHIPYTRDRHTTANRSNRLCILGKTAKQQHSEKIRQLKGKEWNWTHKKKLISTKSWRIGMNILTKKNSYTHRAVYEEKLKRLTHTHETPSLNLTRHIPMRYHPARMCLCAFLIHIKRYGSQYKRIIIITVILNWFRTGLKAKEYSVVDMFVSCWLLCVCKWMWIFQLRVAKCSHKQLCCSECADTESAEAFSNFMCLNFWQNEYFNLWTF